ncbi:MAG: response regulator transcription factor [Burkholderiales bacterium]
MPNPLNIVVVEDHDALRDVTVEALTQRGHNVRGVDCAEALPDEPGATPIDLMVIDLNLPGEDGISLAARIRAAQPNIGIIMVTARDQVRDKMAGYDSGADIYLTKPTSSDELIAAVRALTRRIKPDEPSDCALNVNMTSLNLQGPLGAVGLSSHEASQLAAFVRAKDQQLENWQLMGLTDKEITEHSKKALEVQVVRLRKKLLHCGAVEPSIKAVRGQGYRLCLKLGLSTD